MTLRNSRSNGGRRSRSAWRRSSSTICARRDCTGARRTRWPRPNSPIRGSSRRRWPVSRAGRCSAIAISSGSATSPDWPPMRKGAKAVYCVQHDYRPKEKTKMDGAVQTVYPRKNWSSLMLFNCDHPSVRALTLDVVNRESGAYLHRMQWVADEDIGELPVEWNWLEGWNEKPASGTPNAVHFTRGGPWFRAVAECRLRRPLVRGARRHARAQQSLSAAMADTADALYRDALAACEQGRVEDGVAILHKARRAGPGSGAHPRAARPGADPSRAQRGGAGEFRSRARARPGDGQLARQPRRRPGRAQPARGGRQELRPRARAQAGHRSTTGAIAAPCCTISAAMTRPPRALAAPLPGAGLRAGALQSRQCAAALNRYEPAIASLDRAIALAPDLPTPTTIAPMCSTGSAGLPMRWRPSTARSRSSPHIAPRS